MRVLLAATLLLTATAVLAAERKPPYWASISSGEARMRTGPGLNYPATWTFKRRDLPIRVIGTYPSWRKVRTPDGAEGWILQSLLSDTRTAIVPAGPPRSLRRSPSDSAVTLFRVGPGVVGRLSDCGGGWCRMDVRGRRGFVRTTEIWGADRAERLD